ncbi:MAG: LytR/AlgR family response regulator transcription factor [Eubacteriales bacterium]
MKTILIVEDQRNIQDGLENILMSIDPNLQVIKTGYAKEALRIAKEINIDVFLLDIQLFDYSGMELGEQLRSIDKYLLVPIIFITAIPTQEIMAFKKLHCYDYIVKPFSDQEAKSIIEPIINHIDQPDKPQNEVLQLKQKGVTYNFRQNDIVFIEARNRRLFITTIHETASFSNYTLTSIENDLQKSFIRCHKGFIINCDYVYKINHIDQEILLNPSSFIVPIGRKYSSNVKEL